MCRHLLVLLAFAVLFTGCVQQRAALPERPSDRDLPSLEREMRPFPVRGPAGEAYRFPFLGGLNVPRPQLVDIDADGDADLFLQEESGYVKYFENVGQPGAPRFAWRSSRYQDLRVGEWFRFVDLNDDDAPDLLAEQPYSYIRYYRNTGTPGEPRFESAVDTLRAQSGEPIFSDRQNIPNVTDIDCDGRKDLFLGRLDGTITRYEATQPATAAGVPRFELISEEFEDIRIVSQVAQPGGGVPARPMPGRPNQNPLGGGSNRHGANTMLFADVDDDGDPDLLWGDYFEPGLLLLENTGSCETPVFNTEPKAFPPSDPLISSGYNAPTLGDVDADGDRDLLVGVIGGAYDPSQTAQDNLYYYEYTDTETYDLRTRRFLDGIDVGSESLPTAVDVEGDGDMDLLVSNKIAADDANRGRVFLFRNQGSTEEPSYQMTDTLSLYAAHHLASAAGDLTGDGTPDLIVGSWNEGLAYFRGASSGDGAFEKVAQPFVELSRGSHAAPTLGDLDADGDLDLIVGETTGTLNFFRNTGTASAPQFELVNDAYLDLDVGRRSAPRLVDLDGDGDLDLVVGSESEGLVLLMNTGTSKEPRFERIEDTLLLDEMVPDLTTPAFADVDGDGDLDLFLGTNSGGLLFFRNTR